MAGRGALCGDAGGGGERGSSSCGMSWTTCSGHALGAGEWGRRSNEEAGPGLKCAEPGRSWRRAAAGLLRVCSAGEPAKRCSTRLERVTGTRAAVSRPAISAIKMPDDAACAAPAHGDILPRARAFPRSRTRPRAPFPLSQLLKSSDRPAFRQPTPHPRSLQPLSAWPQVHPQRATRGRVSSQLWTAHPCRTTMLPGCSSWASRAWRTSSSRSTSTAATSSSKRKRNSEAVGDHCRKLEEGLTSVVRPLLPRQPVAHGLRGLLHCRSDSLRRAADPMDQGLREQPGRRRRCLPRHDVLARQGAHGEE